LGMIDLSSRCREFALTDPERQARAANVVGSAILIERRSVCQQPVSGFIAARWFDHRASQMAR
jgi:hypothetical protein